jgi:predicted DNA-binding transcriptional regulator AlpA
MKNPHRTPKFTPLTESRFYRKMEAVDNRYFGVGASKLDEMIRAGEIEPPIKLGDRATGWFGRTIIAWQQKKTSAA